MKPWSQRTLWRALFAAALACLGAVGTALVGDESISPTEAVSIATFTLTAFGGWYGIGAIPGSPTEPFLNNKAPESVEVPVPPAEPAAP